jgi:hypothetical protein
MLYILLSSRCPFKKNRMELTIAAIKNNIVDFSGNYYKIIEPRWKFVSKEAINLCKLMLNKDFIKRPTAEQCLKNIWFKACMKRSQTRKAS